MNAITTLPFCIRHIVLLALAACIVAPRAAEKGENGAIFKSDIFLKKTHESRRQNFEWNFSLSRILATPEWNFEDDPAPLDPGKAWKVAKEWMRKHGCEQPELLQIQLVPFVTLESARSLRVEPAPKLSKRFYYVIGCIPAHFDSMVIYVLMDGTVIEPVQPPRKDLW